VFDLWSEKEMYVFSYSLLKVIAETSKWKESVNISWNSIW
jgi:hypothetical protein